ncbi:MAG: nitroreductase family protein [Elusimicrobia bacterium]|nr:nitroreductase family protein [Elusimicrobiota bacterium]
MRPRRDVFALEYIGETVDAYCKASASAHVDSGELAWAGDVLAAYFSAVRLTPLLASLKSEFEAPRGGAAVSPERLVPYRRGEPALPEGAFAALEAVARHRKSVRWFQRREVPRPLLDAAVACASTAPSACNRQPFVFRIFDDPAWVRRLAAIPMGTHGYHENIPVLIIVMGRLRDFFSERDRHLIYVDGSLAAMTLILALEAQGLSTCCINWPDIEAREAALAEALYLEPDTRAVMFIAVGYADPDGQVAYSKRKPLDQLRSYNDDRGAGNRHP